MMPLLGHAQRDQKPPTAFNTAQTTRLPRFELRIAEYQAAAGLTEARLGNGQKVYLGRTLATNDVVLSATSREDNARRGGRHCGFSIPISESLASQLRWSTLHPLQGSIPPS